MIPRSPPVPRHPVLTAGDPYDDPRFFFFSFKFATIYLLTKCVFAYVMATARAKLQRWRSEGNALPFYPLCPGNRTQVLRFGSKRLSCRAVSPALPVFLNTFTGQVRGCEQRFDDLPDVTQDS